MRRRAQLNHGSNERHPIERLGRWNGTGFEPLAPGSITQRSVIVMSHGWARGLLPAVRTAGGFLAVWEASAETESGRRFDDWYGPLAEAISARIPDAAVLGYTWIDESATVDRAMYAVRSQLRTTVNGQRLAVGLERALDPSPEHAIHLIGFSHGAKVVTIAAALLDPHPTQVTLLDSPDGTLPIVGGALNDLTSYLRVLARTSNSGRATYVDNYVSLFGVRYAERRGLGAVVDVALDPEHLPLDTDATPTAGSVSNGASAAHAYAWRWYLESARHPERGVGFGWSPMLAAPAEPEATQLQQRTSTDAGAADPLALEPAPDAQPSTTYEAVVDRARRQREGPRLLSTEGRRVLRGLFWRRRGDVFVVTPLRWRHGPDDAVVKVTTNRTERARTAKGWSDAPDHRLPIPLGGAVSGVMLFKVELEADESAAVEVYPSPAIYGFRLPPFAEHRVWIYPVLMTAIGATIGFVAFGAARQIVRASRSARRSRARIRMRNRKGPRR